MVTFKYRAIRYKADEVGTRGETIDVVLDFGTCEVAKKAKVPNHPVNDELQNCPFYQSLDRSTTVFSLLSHEDFPPTF